LAAVSRTPLPAAGAALAATGTSCEEIFPRTRSGLCFVCRTGPST
jgi:hypothetical protein